MPKLNIYKASAGSGKTFALTIEYFKIIFRVPAEYKNILAVTFTNKATEEMKSRIIRELNNLAEGDINNAYAFELKKDLDISDEQLIFRAKKLRTLLLHDYGKISVTTIDRFFQRIVKSFTKELGIFPGYNVELDNNLILDKAVERVMAKMKVNVSLRSWICELMNSNVEGGKSWGVKNRIAELGEELFKENYMLLDRETICKFGDKDFLKCYQQRLNSYVQSYEDQLYDIGKRACAAIVDGGMSVGDFKGGKSGCMYHFYKLSIRNYEEPTTSVRKSIDSIDAWYCLNYDKRTKDKVVYIFNILNGLLKKSIELYDNQFRYYNTSKQILGNLYQLGILSDLYKEVRNYCDEKGVMLLSDTAHVLNVLIAGNDTSFLFEKTGNFYKHLMIDEFQDTSFVQWNNFRPLMINSLSEGSNAMIVGDVKQSIYRWRNGDWGLLASGVEKEFRALGTVKVSLVDNWRSAKEIVSFNNLFFTNAASRLKEFYDRDAGENNSWSTAIEDAYGDVVQNPKLSDVGYVDVKFGPEKSEKGSDWLLLEGVVSVINDIRSRGGQLKDMVILVRGAKEGISIANYLMQYNKNTNKGIDFISNDSLYIWSSPYVKFISAVLRYVVVPYDLVNKVSVFYYYSRFIEKCENSVLHKIFKEKSETEVFEYLHTEFSINSGKIMSYSLFETVEVIIDKFNLKYNTDEVPYLIAFQNLIFEYETTESNNIIFFLEWWENEKSKRVLTTSEGINAIKILTIHKSKGLEFKYVILPFCSWELDSVRPTRCIWCRNKQSEFAQLEYVPLNYSSKLAETFFEEDYYDEHLKAYVDNLNLLYVAFTRAKTELYIRPYSPKINKDGSVSMSTIGSFIYYIFNSLKEVGNMPLPIGEDMDLQYGKRLEQSASVEPGKGVLTLKHYPVYNLESRIKVRYKYLDYTDLKDNSKSAINEGKLFHEIFRNIEYLDDIEHAIQNLYLEGLIPHDKKAEYRTLLAKYMDNQQAVQWFDRKYKVIAERDILLHFGERVRPDRVIMSESETIVIDYKFGQTEEAKYLKQVRFYRITLRQMGYKNVKAYVWYVKLNKIIQVS